MKHNKILTAVRVATFLAFVLTATLVSAKTATDSGEDSLTFHGFTLYGTIDAGIAYQTHGTPLNLSYGSGLGYSVQKNSNNSIT